jgi:small subunit ribosomal protein S7
MLRIVTSTICGSSISTQVPIPIKDKHSRFMGMKWLLLAARDKGRNEPLPPRLAQEIIAAAANEVRFFSLFSPVSSHFDLEAGDFKIVFLFASQGRVVQRKKDLHRQCEANKAFAHYRWA